jgi:DNA-binding NtrC family response regulator
MAQIDCPEYIAKSKLSAKKSQKVLIAEDDKVLRLMTAKLLEVSGYQVSTCDDGQKAIQLIENNSYDLVITDLMMPGATGIEVLRATRRTQPRTMVIMITGSPSPQNLLEAKREGAYAYLQKPFNLKQFLSILQNAVEHIRTQDSYQPSNGKDYTSFSYP